MADIKTKSDIQVTGSEVTRVWKSQALSNGDVLFTGLLEVWDVQIQDPTIWATPGWTVGSGATRGRVTFNLTGPTTGRVVVRGR